MKRAFIVHGWDGSPRDSWLPWLKDELEKRDFLVDVPSMPHPEHPTINDWIGHLSMAIQMPDKDTYFIGHSIGCQAVLRYVEQLDSPVGGLVCVAGWFRLLHLATEEEKEIAKPWVESMMNFEKIKRNIPRIIAIFSDNDPYVDLGDKDLFETYLNAKTIIEYQKGHFSDDAGIKELPSALTAVLELAEGKL